MSNVEPEYVMATVGHTTVMRRMGSQRTHLVDAPLRFLTPVRWIGPVYWALLAPAVALCGAILRPDHRGLVVMQQGSEIKCLACRRQAQALGLVVSEERKP